MSTATAGRTSRNGTSDEAAISTELRGDFGEFPYRWDVLPFDRLFVDREYQRPLTNFVKLVRENFDPVLFQVLAVSERRNNKYAIIDGQTRWSAAQDRGMTEGPCLVYEGLSRAEEARVFERLQTQRRGMTSWHRFRAALVAKNPEAVAVHRLARDCGYQMGQDAKTHIASPGALEACFRRDAPLLERTLLVLKEAWPNEIPKGSVIRGVHRFFRDAEREASKKNGKLVDDERLVRRLKVVGQSQLLRRAAARSEGAGHSGSGGGSRYIAEAVAIEYEKKGA